MQANCLVFPSPKTYDITSIQNKIILIPRSAEKNLHCLYNPQCTQSTFNKQDDFAQYLISIQQTSKRDKARKKSDTQTVAQNENSGMVQGNLNMQQKVSSDQYVPCLFLTGTKSKIIVFFHANGEDICSAYEFIRLVSLQTRYPVLAMEYRGYSIYQGQTTPQNIQKDAARVIQFLKANRFTNDQIVLFGRSIGSAVALTVTQKYSVHSAVLLSPFISLKKIVKDLYGSCAQSVIKQSFENEQNCRQIKCPLLIIHGSKDTLVPYQHSMKLISGCQSYCRLKVIENMTHTKFNFRLDFIRHFSKFMIDLQ